MSASIREQLVGDETKTTTKAGRFPPWLRKRIPAGGEAREVRRLLAELGLATVCAGAHCPNMPECYARGTAAGVPPAAKRDFAYASTSRLRR